MRCKTTPRWSVPSVIGYGIFLLLMLAVTCPVLAAPIYPGPLERGPEKEEWTEGVPVPRLYQVYYTRDAFDRVVSFYRRHLKPTSTGVEEVDFDDVAAGRAGYEAVIVRRYYSGLTEQTLFDPLQEEMTAVAAGMRQGTHGQKDLDAVRAKYGYLAKFAFFPGFSAKEKLQACRRQVDSGTDTARAGIEDYGRRMEELARQGRFAEMQQLVAGRGMQESAGMQQAMKVSHWDDWVACLDDLDRHAFRTEIWVRKK